jgi:hypothetical protein
VANNPIPMPAAIADRRCGAIDETAKFPEPAHYDCKECRSAIKRLLLLRVPAVAHGPRPLQMQGPWMNPEDE